MSGNRKNEPAPGDPHVSVSFAARALGVSRPTVHARVSAGLLEAGQSAGRTVIVRASLDRLLREQRETVPA